MKWRTLGYICLTWPGVMGDISKGDPSISISTGHNMGNPVRQICIGHIVVRVCILEILKAVGAEFGGSSQTDLIISRGYAFSCFRPDLTCSCCFAAFRALLWERTAFRN